MQTVKPDLFAIAWAAQARWLNERSEEALKAFDRALMTYLASVKQKEPR